MKFWLISFLVGLVFVQSGFSQYNDYNQGCSNYHKYNCGCSENIYYKYNDASRSALFLKGQTSRLKLEVYNGRDYRISICADEILGNVIGLKIIDTIEGTVLYDNSHDDYAQEFEFTVTETKELDIEVNVPGANINPGENGRNGILRKNTKMGCLGVLIEYMVTPRKGF